MPEQQLDIDVVRAWKLPPMLRADSDDEDGYLGTMEVRFSRFGTWYEVDSWWEGRFLERTVAGAFLRTINSHNAARSDDAHRIITLFDHGGDPFIGRKILGPITSLTEESDSPVSLVRLFDTSYNRDLVPGLRAGVYGSSYIFRTVVDEWNYEPGASAHNPEGLPERTVREAKVFEAGPVTWPANPGSTAGMRCLSGTDLYYEQLMRSNPQHVEGLRAKRLEVLRPGGPTVEPMPDSAEGHSVSIKHVERARRLREARLSLIR